jgi:hypothetical protein
MPQFLENTMQQFTGKQYLQIDIANAFGKDKWTWDERLDWFKVYWPTMQGNFVAACKEADEPAQALAGLMAYQAVLDGKPTGYLCGMDATSSGLQLLTLLSGCEQSARTCNLIDTGRREDAYTLAYEGVNRLLGTSGKIPRKDIKQAVMTHLYSSTAVPKRVFGEDTPELKAFYQVIEELFPGADQLNRDLMKLWNPEAMAHTWTLPDGFDVVIKSMITVEHPVTFLGTTHVVVKKEQAPQLESRCLPANIVHSIDGMVVREMNRRCNYTAETINAFQELFYNRVKGGQSTCRTKDIQLLRLLELAEIHGFTSAVIFEYVDESNYGLVSPGMRSKLINLVDSMPATSFPLVCIHDCFKFHANYGDDVRRQYRQILSELAGSEILPAIASEITGRTITATKGLLTLPEKIREAEYALS